MEIKISKTKLMGLYKLSRIGTIMDFFPILIILAITSTRTKISWEMVIAILACLAIIVTAFIINDINDADDDAMDPKKVNRNPISGRKLTVDEGYSFFLYVFFIGAFLLISLGTNAMIIGLIISLLGVLYSLKPIRLKARPIVDVLSHAFFLAAGQIILFGMLNGSKLDIYSISVAVGVFIFSVGGDMYNEIRDWEVDRKSGLVNTASILGFKASKYLGRFLHLSGVLIITIAMLALYLPMILNR